MSLLTHYVKCHSYKYILSSDQYVVLKNFEGVSIFEKHYRLQKNVLEIKAGYAWDGPSGLTWDTANTLTPSLVHDVLYQAIREGHLPKRRRFDADLEFYQLLCGRSRGWFGELRAFYFFIGVRLFGGSSIMPKKQGEAQDHILTAP